MVTSQNRNAAWAIVLSASLAGSPASSTAEPLRWASARALWTPGHAVAAIQNREFSSPQNNVPKGAPVSPNSRSSVPATPTSSTRNPGRNVGGLSTGEDAAIAAGIAGAVTTGILLWHHHETHKLPNTEQLVNNGPNVPDKFDMNHFVVKGLIGPNWPLALDFRLDAPGAVKMNIETAEHQKYEVSLTNPAGARGISIFHLTGLPDKLQPATFDIEAVGAQGSATGAPVLNVYGMAVGPKAVGSIGIDQVTFGPSSIRLQETAQYGFHSHSDFSNVRAGFLYTFQKDGHVLLKEESEEGAGPVAQEARPQGVWTSTKNVGQHMLQIRAWRGYAGDWCVAWSPDIVFVAK